MRRLGRALSFALVVGNAACTSTPTARYEWEARLSGDTIALLGEVHDNAEQHRLRLAVLRRAIERGWRPAIALEQLDREHQADVDRARRERPHDAQHLIDTAVPAAEQRGWEWDYYRPVIALALEHDLPLLAADLSNADAMRIVRGGDAAVFDAPARAAIGLDRPIAPSWLAAQEREVDEGHCHLLPPALLPSMARAQLTRDAVMASVLRAHASNGVVLLAGDGHVRRDIGVPRWLGREAQPRVLAVAFLEDDADPAMAAAFDAVVRTRPQPRPDPCEGVHPPAARNGH